MCVRVEEGGREGVGCGGTGGRGGSRRRGVRVGVVEQYQLTSPHSVLLCVAYLEFHFDKWLIRNLLLLLLLLLLEKTTARNRVVLLPGQRNRFLTKVKFRQSDSILQRCRLPATIETPAGNNTNHLETKQMDRNAGNRLGGRGRRMMCL